MEIKIKIQGSPKALKIQKIHMLTDQKKEELQEWTKVIKINDDESTPLYMNLYKTGGSNNQEIIKHAQPRSFN